MRLAGFALLAVAAPCPAQNPTPKPGAPVVVPTTYRIAGRVVNASTGEPVRRASVAVLSEQDSQMVATTLTDADGNFVLENLPAGKYPLSASRRGYRTGFYDEHDEYNSAIVTGPDQDTTHIVFRLMPNAVIRGVVTGDGGDPVENASVILFKREHTAVHGGAGGEIRQADGAQTDDTGAYEFSNLAAGDYYVAVSTTPWYAMHPPSRGDANQESPLDVAYPVTFFDSTTEEASATPIAIEAGSSQQADISLHAVPALRLQVAVQRNRTNSIVQPELRTLVFGTQVSAESGLSGDPLHTGFVEFAGVAPGHYELQQGDPPRISELDAGSNQVIDANTGAMAPAVSGTIRTTVGAPLPDSVNLLLEPLNRPNDQTALAAIAQKGEFRFDAVPPGTWTLSAQSQGTILPIVEIVAGKTATPGSQLIVNDRPLSVSAIVSPSLSRVQGFARTDGKGVAGAMIVLVPRQASAYRALVRRDQSDSDGSFSLRDVPAGKYTVIAILDGWKLDWTDPETMARYLPHGVAVSVSDQSGGIVNLAEPVPVQ